MLRLLKLSHWALLQSTQHAWELCVRKSDSTTVQVSSFTCTVISWNLISATRHFNLEMGKLHMAKTFGKNRWNQVYNTETEAIPADTLLLLCKDAVKRAGAVLYIENNKEMMLKKPVTLELTSSGQPKKSKVAEQIMRIRMRLWQWLTAWIWKVQKYKASKPSGNTSVEILNNNDDESVAILKGMVSLSETLTKLRQICWFFQRLLSAESIVSLHYLSLGMFKFWQY